jgi:UDP-N-acetyl-D-galactosamine dehydrogenase
MNIDCYDPWVSTNSSFQNDSFNLIHDLNKDKYDAIIIAVAHNEFIEMAPEELRMLCRDNGIIYDLKHVLDKSLSDLRI